MPGKDNLLYFICGGSEEVVKSVIEWCSDHENQRSDIFEERIKKANELVDAGNELFKANDAANAKYHYLAAAYHGDFDFGQELEFTTEHKTQIRNLMIRILLNLANNSLKMKEYNVAKLSCSIGLDLGKTDPDCPKETLAKFFYRRARAEVELQQFEEAMADAKKAIEFMPSDPQIRETYNRAAEGAKKEIDQTKNVWKGKNLFGDVPDDLDLPKVELVLRDNAGNPIPERKRSHSDVKEKPSEKSMFKKLLDLICCKRKHKSL
jgi:tetratricopeptide (TPR) repeat protein